MPAAKTCDSLDAVRTEIDRVDRTLLPLLAERAEYVRQAAAFKPTRDAVVQPDRIAAIVAHIRDMAVAEGMDPDLAEDLWRGMIDAFIRFEGREWDKGPE